jgi:hypothetical protein
MGSQLGCDHRTLYYSSDRSLPVNEAKGGDTDDHIWRISLTPWLEAHGRTEPATPSHCTVG